MKEKGILTIHINIACPIDLMHATIARSGCHFCCCDCSFSIKVHCSTENKTTKSLDSQKDRNALIWKRVLLDDPISIPFACFHRRTERNRKAFEKQTGETRFCVQAKMRIPSLLFSLLQLTASSVQFRKREKEQDTRVPASLAWHAALPSCRVNYESRACVRILPVLFLLPKSETSQSTLTTRSVVWFFRCYPWYFNSMLHRITRFTLRLCNCARSDFVKFNRFVFRRHTFRI